MRPCNFPFLFPVSMSDSKEALTNTSYYNYFCKLNRCKTFDLLRFNLPCLFRAGLLCLLLLSTSLVFAQNTPERKKLEKEKKENLQQIKETQRILAETSSQRKSSIGQLNAINQQIGARKSLITSISQELALLGSQIDEITSVIIALEEDLANLKKEYAYMVYAASKSNNSYDRLVLLFSARTFNQLYMRLQYMRQYSEARKNQVEQIQKVKQTLLNQKETIEGKRLEQKVLLDQQMIANQDLLALQRKQRAVVRELNEQESELKKEMAVRQREVKKLESVIANLIEEEMKKEAARQAAAEAATAVATVESPAAPAAITTSAEALSGDFARSKAQLQWPVATGFISQKFGRNPHPVMKNIMVPNDGVDIQTNRDAPVKAIFNGTVKLIASLPGPGSNKAVIVQHGEYFTVYSRLKEVKVKQGQALKAEDPIGSVYTDGNGVSALQFQIWHNQEKLNPEAWLRKK